MPPSRAQPHDSFSTSFSAAPPLRHQASHPSLRSNASAASARTRQQRDLLAPISRRPTGRTTPHIETDVLADTDSASEHDQVTQRAKPLRRSIRSGGSPARLKAKQSTAEQEDVVNRGPNGSYFLEGGALIGMPVPSDVADEDMNQKALQQQREEESALARRYFTTGEHLRPPRVTRKHNDDDGESRAHTCLSAVY